MWLRLLKISAIQKLRSSFALSVSNKKANYQRTFLRLTMIVVWSLLALTCFEVAVPQAPRPTRTVLVLFDEHTDLPGLSVWNKSIASTLNSDPSFKTDIYVESMNLSRLQRDGYEELLRDHYKEKYKNKKIDVVIAALGPSLTFELNHMQEIAPGAPIVFSGVDPNEFVGRDHGDNITGVLVKRDFGGTLKAALQMQPDTREVVLVGGTSDFDKRLIENASQQLKEFEDKVSITFLVGETLENTLKTVSQLPPHTIVLYSTFFRDGAGETFVPHDVASMVSEAANAPVYGFVDQYLGRGIVGGYLYSFEVQGKKAADYVLRILHGERPKDIPVIEGDANVNMFDARQLKRWNIDEAALPQGSVVLFKEPTLWEEYHWYIAGFALLLTLESFLIGLLVYLRYRRKQAELETVHLNSRLMEIVSNVPGIVWETRTDPATNLQTTTFISDYVLKMTGYSAEEWLNEPPGFGLRRTVEEDRERVMKDVSVVLESGNESISEFRSTTKDGRIQWIENYLSPIFEGGAKVVGMRGVALDVTDRKLAEENALRTEEKDRALLSAIPDLMFLQSEDGVYLDFHAKDPDELLVPPESFLGKNMRDVLPADLALRFAECFACVKDGGKPAMLEYSIDIGGTTEWFEARMVRSGDKILSVVRDITDLKRAQLEAQEFSGRLISAQEDERARLARELHDGACQNLALLAIELELLGRDLKTDDRSIKGNVKVLSERVADLSNDLRQMSHQLHPARLSRLGFGSAVRGLCNEIETAHSLKIEFVERDVPIALPALISLNLYRIVQESLQNVVKHSNSTQASVSISGNGEMLHLSISDDGRGFNPQSSVPKGSLGLISMRERIRLLNGEISIKSRPGGGTRIDASIPLKQNS